ncbi:MAG: acetyltransferase [Pseudomonadota bacterium]
MHFDVFNGDADGLCALHQLRLADPVESTLVTGVKRDIALVQRVPLDASSATVLDVSFEKNVDAVRALLEAGVPVRYFDHHFPGDIPAHPALDCHIDTRPTVCTGLIVNAVLGGAHLPWAVTAAFGDNLIEAARTAAAPLGLDETALTALCELGTLLNYNGYGAGLDDLLFDPAILYRDLSAHREPGTFIAEDPAFQSLREGHASDVDKAQALTPRIEDDTVSVTVLPNARWARRISGVHANQLANAHPERAHALLTEKDGGYLVSVRAPLTRRTGADAVCRQFDTGGGRAAAAGINTLPEADVDRFVATLRDTYAR